MIATSTSDVLDNLDLDNLSNAWSLLKTRRIKIWFMLSFVVLLLHIFYFSYGFLLEIGTSLQDLEILTFSFILYSMCVSAKRHKIYRLVKIAMRYSFDLAEKTFSHTCNLMTYTVKICLKHLRCVKIFFFKRIVLFFQRLPASASLLRHDHSFVIRSVHNLERLRQPK